MLISRLKAFLNAAGWVAETEIVDRRRAIKKLSSWSAATLDIAENSFKTYKSDILAAISCHGGRNRPSGIRDVSGIYRDIHELLAESDYPNDLKFISGTFFHFLDERAIAPSDIGTETLALTKGAGIAGRHGSSGAGKSMAAELQKFIHLVQIPVRLPLP